MAALAVLVGVIAALRLARAALLPVQFLSGWLLLAGMAVLALYAVRKRLPALPLGRAATWKHLHVNLGLFLLVVFAMHTRVRLPDGALDLSLGAAFLIVSLSGILGTILGHIVPPRLASVGEEVVYEQIPELRRRLSEAVEKLVLGAVRETTHATLADFYLQHLSEYFERPMFFWHHVAQYGRPWRNLIQALDAQERFLSDAERQKAQQLRRLIQAKADLDYHYALQTMLKAWPFVHVPITAALLILAAAHAAVVCWYHGGVL